MYSVLIVDDEPIIREGIKAILGHSDLKIARLSEASNGVEALTALQDFLYDIIITDIRMPKMDGLQLCQKIHKRCPQLSLIIISGYDDFSYAQAAIKYGVKNYILKPVTTKKLLATMYEVIEKIEQEKTYLYITYQQMNEVLQNLEKGVWEQTPKSISNAYNLIVVYTTKLSTEHTFITCKQILKALLNRLSLKIGYSVSLDISHHSLTTKQSVYRWLSEELESISAEFKGLLINTSYNIIEMSKAYVIENYNKDITLEDIASSINLSTSYFSTLFKQKTGQTFVQYRTAVRLKKAKEFLLHTNKSITEIAYEIGFNDTTHFTRTFKKIYDKTPSEFRKSMT